MDLVNAYRSTHGRLIDLESDLTADESSTTVTPTPAWSVKDAYAHLVGAIDDILTGNLDGYGTNAWTAVHVTDRQSDSLGAICREWCKRAPEFEKLLASTGDQYLGLVAGSWTHEQDIRGSIGLRGIRATGGMHATLEQVDEIGARIDATGIGALRVVTEGSTWVLGVDPVGATLSTSEYEMARLVYGRRSIAQVRDMSWDGDPGPYLSVIGKYGLADSEITD